MLTLQQMKDDISAARKDLVVFERKRAMMREAHLELLSFCWFDGMEIDHDAVSTNSPEIESIDNEIKALIIATELYSRTINAMEKLHKLISADYGMKFAEKEDEVVTLLKNKDDLDEKNRDMLSIFKKIRKLFPPAGDACVLWEGFPASDKEALQNLLAKADEAIAQEKGQDLYSALTEMFIKQAPLLKSQVEDRLHFLKNEREQLEADLSGVSARDIAEKCGKPYWVEVSGSEQLFMRNNAFPIPNYCAGGFVKEPIDSFETDLFHYKRHYADDDELSTMRIYGFSSKEEFYNVERQWHASNKHTDEIEWARFIISEIEEFIYYKISNELFPQWKDVLERAISILEKENSQEEFVEKGKDLLKLPVLELRNVV